MDIPAPVLQNFKQILNDFSVNLSQLSLIDFEPPMIKNLFHAQRLLSYKSLEALFQSSCSQEQRRVLTIAFIEHVDSFELSKFTLKLKSLYLQSLHLKNAYKTSNIIAEGITFADLKLGLSNLDFEQFSSILVYWSIELEKSVDLLMQANLYGLCAKGSENKPSSSSMISSTDLTKVKTISNDEDNLNFSIIIAKYEADAHPNNKTEPESPLDTKVTVEDQWFYDEHNEHLKEVGGIMTKVVLMVIEKLTSCILTRGFSWRSVTILGMIGALYSMFGEALAPIAFIEEIGISKFLGGILFSKILEELGVVLEKKEICRHIKAIGSSLDHCLVKLQEFNKQLELAVRRCFIWENRITNNDEYQRGMGELGLKIKEMLEPEEMKNKLERFMQSEQKKWENMSVSSVYKEKIVEDYVVITKKTFEELQVDEDVLMVTHS